MNAFEPWLLPDDPYDLLARKHGYGRPTSPAVKVREALQGVLMDGRRRMDVHILAAKEGLKRSLRAGQPVDDEGMSAVRRDLSVALNAAEAIIEQTRHALDVEIDKARRLARANGGVLD